MPPCFVDCFEADGEKSNLACAALVPLWLFGAAAEVVKCS